MSISSVNNEHWEENEDSEMEESVECCCHPPWENIAEHQAIMPLDENNQNAIEFGERLCPELLGDVLPLILGKISFLGYLCFRGVCREWRLASMNFPTENLPRNQPPWLMYSDESTSGTTRMLLDPLYKKVYTIEIPELCGVRCLASGHGWLLILSVRLSSLYFFSPFTKARIDVPYMDCFSAVTFTAPPTSPDCIIFGIGQVSSIGMTDMRFCRRGEHTWTIQIVGINHFQPFIQVVFCGELFYCMDLAGKMGIFSVFTDQWNELHGPSIYGDRIHLIESEGELMACVKNVFRNTVDIFRLNGYYWVKVNDIKERMFFIGHHSVSVPATNATKNLVFLDTFRLGSVGVAYNLNDGSFDEKIHHKHCWCSNFLWIEPRWIQHSASLRWHA